MERGRRFNGKLLGKLMGETAAQGKKAFPARRVILQFGGTGPDPAARTVRRTRRNALKSQGHFCPAQNEIAVEKMQYRGLL